MEDVDYGKVVAQIRGCKIAKVDTSDPDEMTITLDGGEGFQLIADFKKLEFYNDSLTFYASTGNPGYDYATRVQAEEWKAVEAEVVLTCRERISMLYDPLSLVAILLPSMKVDTNWDGFFHAHPMMN